MYFTEKWLDSSEVHEPKEDVIFRLMAIIAELHLPRATDRRESKWAAWLNQIRSDGLIQESLNSLKDVDQHLLDLFLRIAVMIHFDSADLIFNNVEKHPGPFGDEWNGINGRLVGLFRHKRFWEAQGLLGYCLKYSSLQDQKRLLSQYCSAVGSGGLSQDEIRMALTYLIATMTHLTLVRRGGRWYRPRRPRVRILKLRRGNRKTRLQIRKSEQQESTRTFMRFERFAEIDQQPAVPLIPQSQWEDVNDDTAEV